MSFLTETLMLIAVVAPAFLLLVYGLRVLFDVVPRSKPQDIEFRIGFDRPPFQIPLLVEREVVATDCLYEWDSSDKDNWTWLHHWYSDEPMMWSIDTETVMEETENRPLLDALSDAYMCGVLAKRRSHWSALNESHKTQFGSEIDPWEEPERLVEAHDRAIEMLNRLAK